jgi:uncharacterized Rossmann fold enzyme
MTGIPERWKDAVERHKAEYKLSDDEITTWFPDHVPTDGELDALKDRTAKLLFCVLPEEAAAQQQKFMDLFRVLEWFVFPGTVICKALPLLLAEWKESKMAGTVETRHAQIRENSAKVKRRLPHPTTAPHGGTCAIVCYGPSLLNTWPGIQGQRKYQNAAIVTVSGAHDFLIERGIVPDYHVDMDPREHKAVFTKSPHEGVKYLIASCAHPKLVENLLGHDLTLFHTMNGTEDQELIGEIEPEGWLVNGGGSAGLRAISVMHSLGYRKFAIFGMDHSFRNETRHAGHHPREGVQASIPIKCGARWFQSSPVLVAYTKHFLMMMQELLKDSEFFLFGDGLLQEAARIAMRK